MSLMFAALKKLESPQAAPLALPVRTRNALAVPALAVALGATGLGGWWIGSHATDGAAHVAMVEATRPLADAASAQTLPLVDLGAPSAPVSLPLLAAGADTDSAPASTASAGVAAGGGDRARDELVQASMAAAMLPSVARVAAPSAAQVAAPAAAAAAALPDSFSLAAGDTPRAAPLDAPVASHAPYAPPATTTAASASFQATAAAVSAAMSASQPPVQALGHARGESSESARRDPDFIDAQAVARVVASLETSVQAGDRERAQASLSELATLLPAQSLTLLRMRAWVAHQGGETEAALVLYRDIVGRVPGDRTAAINLAILEAGSGDSNGARQRLRELRSGLGDSGDIDRAIAQVEATLRAGRQ
jgi:hypothetical protein